MTNPSSLVVVCFHLWIVSVWLITFGETKSSPQLARFMAVLQQQRQQQAGVLGGSSKLSPSHHGGVGGGGPKLPGADTLLHPGLTASMADMHQKSLGPYSGQHYYTRRLKISLKNTFQQDTDQTKMFDGLNIFLCFSFSNLPMSRVWIWSQPSRSRPGGIRGAKGPRESAVPLQVDDGGTVVS